MPGTNLNNLDAYNEVATTLGGAGGDLNDIDTVNAIAVLEGTTGGHLNMINALNAIDVDAGGPGGHLNTLDALNSIVVLKGGVGGHENDLEAINEWVDFAFVGPLDDNPGAAVGYSVRRLTNTFTDDLLRVRRSSDDAEQDIGFTGVGDLDTAALEAFCGAGDGFVVTFYDQSGNGDDITQATASDQPQIVDSGSTILRNGRPTLRFDGTDDFIQNTSIPSIVQPEHCYCVFTQITWASVRSIFDGNANARMNLLQTLGGAPPDLELRSGAGGPTSDPDLALGTTGLIEAIFDGASSSIRTNNSSPVSGNAGSQDGGGVTLGARGAGGNGVNADISEFILYLSTPSDAAALRADIIAYFGI